MADKKKKRIWLRILLVVVGVPVLALVVLMGYLSVVLKNQGSPLALKDQIVGVHEISYSWIIRTKQGAILVDAGNDRGATKIKQALKKMGLAPKSVHTILLTHGHTDHISGMLSFPQAKVWIGPNEIDVIKRKAPVGGAFQRIFANLTKAFPLGNRKLQELTDRQLLKVDGETFRVIHTPGHTQGSVMYLWKDILFSGDTLQSAKQGVQLLPSLMMQSIPQTLRSLQKLVPLSFSNMADGHIGLTSDAHNKLQIFLKK